MCLGCLPASAGAQQQATPCRGGLAGDAGQDPDQFLYETKFPGAPAAIAVESLYSE